MYEKEICSYENTWLVNITQLFSMTFAHVFYDLLAAMLDCQCCSFLNIYQCVYFKSVDLIVVRQLS
jgi:hypothetical protein